MKRAMLLHNPDAGDEEHDQEELVGIIEKHGFACDYASVKEEAWKALDFDADFLVVAGGDGTVRKVIKALVNRKMLDKTWPIALLPYGTANNIAKTLNLYDDIETLVRSWHQPTLKPFDVGRMSHIEESDFFLESLGFGIFPYLMKEMKKRKNVEAETPEEKIIAALKLLHEIILSYEPRNCHLVVDGKDHSGKYILAEIMNTQSFGPNLFLAPEADPGDGLLEIVLISDKDKDLFAQYIISKIKGNTHSYAFSKLQGKEVTVGWDGKHVHVDDEVFKPEEGEEIQIELKKGLLEFLVP